jgi:hypothetical protein
MIYKPSFITIGSGIQVTLSFLPQQSERLQCWYYWQEGFMKYVLRCFHHIHTKFHEEWVQTMLKFCLSNLRDCNVGITDGRYLQSGHWDGLWWHDIGTKLHDDRFRHSSNIEVITSKISEAAVLVLPMGDIYEVLCCDGRRWHHIHISFHKGQFRHSEVVMEDTHTDTDSKMIS